MPSPRSHPKANRVLVFAHRHELLQQAKTQINRANPDLTVAIEQVASLRLPLHPSFPYSHFLFFSCLNCPFGRVDIIAVKTPTTPLFQLTLLHKKVPSFVAWWLARRGGKRRELSLTSWWRVWRVWSCWLLPLKPLRSVHVLSPNFFKIRVLLQKNMWSVESFDSGEEPSHFVCPDLFVRTLSMPLLLLRVFLAFHDKRISWSFMGFASKPPLEIATLVGLMIFAFRCLESQRGVVGRWRKSAISWTCLKSWSQ